MSEMLAEGTLLHGSYAILRVVRTGEAEVTYLAERQAPRPAGAPQWLDVRQMLVTSGGVDADLRSFLQVRADVTTAWLRTLSHPNLTVFDDCFEADGRVYVVSEHVAGPTLHQRVSEGEGLASEAEVLRWTEQICDALQYLHEQQPPVIVRDLDPQHVVLSEDGVARLVDVGLAQRFDRRRADTLRLDPRVDVYGLGSLLYFALTRVRLPDARTRLFEANAGQEPVAVLPLHRLNPDTTVRVEMAVEQMLELEPSRRPADVDAVRRLLGLKARPHLPVPPPAAVAAPPAVPTALEAPPPPVAPAPPPPRPHPQTLPPRLLSPAGSGRGIAPAAAADGPVSFTAPAVLLLLLFLAASAGVIRLLYLDRDEVRVHQRRGSPQAERALRQRRAARPPDDAEATLLMAPDGGVMVRVNGGPVRVGAGSDDSPSGPQRKRSVAAFYVDRTEVTFRQFRDFALSAAYAAQGPWQSYLDPDRLERPVVGVTWFDAREYCAHYGLRLPTEAEWEKAAHGEKARHWPWGDVPAPADAVTVETATGLEDVGSRPQGASRCGALDMAGNVWEWTDAAYARYEGSTASSDLFDRGLKVLRGGSWNFPLDLAATTVRMPMAPHLWSADVGFRCVKTAPRK